MTGIETLMVTEMITAAPSDTVAQTVARMSQNRIGAVLVTEGGQLIGLFSERDLMNRVVAEKKDPANVKVGDVATKNVVTIDVGQPLKKVLEVFREGKFRHLPVIKDGKPAGILSTRDFLEFLVGGFERYVEEVLYRKELAEGTDPYDHLGGSYGL
jgi:CBS domain-containing protein